MLILIGRFYIKLIVIFKVLKYRINRNVVWLFERHKNIPKPNNIIIIFIISFTVCRVEKCV